MVGNPGVEPGLSSPQAGGLAVSLVSGESGPGESNPVYPRPERGGLPSSSNPWSGELFRPGHLDSRRDIAGYLAHGCRAPARHVEKAGIEPTASTLARRDRCLSCHPREWTAPDLNREPPPCHGGAPPVGAISPQPPLPGTAAGQDGHEGECGDASRSARGSRGGRGVEPQGAR
jgi:hypothetical protein